MKPILEFLKTILCGIAVVIGLLAGGIVLVVAILFNGMLSPESI